MQIKAIIFDLDQTLMDRDTSLTNFTEIQYERFKENMPGIAKADYMAAVQLHDDNGYKPKTALYHNVCHTLQINSLKQETLVSDYYNNFGKHPVLFPQAISLLTRLYKKYTLAMITNGTSIIQNRKIDNSGIRSYFQSILISEEVGFNKPDARIFQKSLDELGLKAEQCVFVGDNPEADIEAAHKAGMSAIWMENARFTPPSCEHKNIREIKDVIKHL